MHPCTCVCLQLLCSRLKILAVPVVHLAPQDLAQLDRIDRPLRVSVCLCPCLISRIIGIIIGPVSVSLYNLVGIV